MHKSKIVYKNNVLKNKSAKLDTIFDPNNEVVNEISV